MTLRDLVTGSFRERVDTELACRVVDLHRAYGWVSSECDDAVLRKHLAHMLRQELIEYVVDAYVPKAGVPLDECIEAYLVLWRTDMLG